MSHGNPLDHIPQGKSERGEGPPTSDNQGAILAELGRGGSPADRRGAVSGYHGQLLYSNSLGHLYKQLGGGNNICTPFIQKVINSLVVTYIYFH